MDEFNQAAHDGNLPMLEQQINTGNTNVKEAFYTALRARQLVSMDFLMPYIDIKDLHRVMAEAKVRRHDDIFERVAAYVANPKPKKLPYRLIPTTFIGCLMDREQFQTYDIDYDSPLGEGTYGKVYIGKHRPSNLSVAIKIMQKIRIHPDDLQIIQHECEMLSQLTHPNIIQIHGGYDDDTSYYWILSLMRGGTLQEYVINHGKLSVFASINLFYQLVQAVNYCHQRNIIHRDIKADNILLQDSKVDPEEVQIVLGDFGYATVQKPGDRFSDYIGTPLYQSPEIMAQQPYDGRAADIWAMGVVLYYTYFRVLPFLDPDLKEKILYYDPDYHEDEISMYLGQILDKDPSTRVRMVDLLDSFEYMK
jgi:tRNA A-37 threonylcarbamoyl transferase component Bud32